MTRDYDFIFDRLKYLWNKCESDLLYNKASDFIRKVLIKYDLRFFNLYRALVGLNTAVIYEPILSAIRRVSGPLLSIRRTTWRRSMGRKTPQGRAGKLIRPLTNRITNRFTNRDGLRLTTANLVVSNCSDESDQTKGKSPAVQDRVSTAIHALLKFNQRTDSPGL